MVDRQRVPSGTYGTPIRSDCINTYQLYSRYIIYIHTSTNLDPK